MIHFIWLTNEINKSLNKIKEQKQPVKRSGALSTVKQPTTGDKWILAFFIVLIILLIISTILWLAAWITISRCSKKWDSAQLSSAVALQLFGGPVGSLTIIYSLNCNR